jgi:hypothetical protein
MQIKCPILASHQSSRTEFVQFWERLYFGYNEDFYKDNIGQPLTQDLIEEWFKWKNGSPLSAQKAKTIRRYFSPDHERVEHDAASDTLTTFLNKPGGAVWRIFWLHLQHPREFPIYDQHVHRAMAFMLDWHDAKREIPTSNSKKIQIYLKEYRPFFCSFNECERRKVDRALWSFGRFLKYYRSVIE